MSPEHVRSESPQAADWITRREALSRLGKGVAAAGIVASGLAKPSAALADASSLSEGTPGVLRSVAWGSAEFYGLFSSGTDVAEVRRLVLDGSTLSPGVDLVGEVRVGEGPVSLAFDVELNRFLVAHSVRHSLWESTYSFNLEADLADWFEKEGVPAREAPTFGTGIHRISVLRPSLTVLDPLDGASQTLTLAGALPEVSLEPVALSINDSSYEIVATSSGRYGTETNLADEVIALSVSRAGAIARLRPVVIHLGHDVLDVRAIGTSGDGLTVSVRTPEETRFFIDSGEGFIETPAPPALLRFALHDRVPVSGLPDAWLVEIGPGLLGIESVFD